MATAVTKAEREASENLVRLSARDFKTVENLIENPPEPNAALRKAKAEYIERCPTNAKRIMG